jgi:hypothetical protein
MDKSVIEKIQDPWVENRYNLTSTSAQYPAPQHGGRIPNVLDPSTRDYLPMTYNTYTGGTPIAGYTPRQDLVGHIHKPTPLNEVFFSQANIEKLQKAIQEQVYLMSGPKKFMIDRQNDDDLKIIMRSYYLSFAKNNPQTIAEELADLNGRVVGFASARVYSEADFYQFYLKDLQDFAPPIANPINTASYGTRTGELKSFF